MKRAEPLAGFAATELEALSEAIDYIIKGVLALAELAVFFGESGAMKSFMVLDMLLHIALGFDWCGFRVKRCGVLLIAGEGGAGMAKRLKAWFVRHQVNQDQARIFIATEAADLLRDSARLAATITEAENRIGCPVGVVAFDTLAACFGEGDENSTGDMMAAIKNARQACGNRALIFVHHNGHQQKDRERGAYALRGTADTRILVERADRLITAKCLKRKDGEHFQDIGFEWHQVETGWVDADGDAVTSVILDPTDKRPPKAAPTGKVPGAIIELLETHGALPKGGIASRLMKSGHSHSQIYDRIKTMLASGALVDTSGLIGIAEQQP